MGKVKTFMPRRLPGSDRSSLNYRRRLTPIVLKIKFAPRSKHSLSQLQQDRQCAHNVTLRRVRATIVAVEKQKMLHMLSACL